MRSRIQDLGYVDVKSWPIYQRESGGCKVMYHMIHATDHEEAPKLMYRAYRKVASGNVDIEQFALCLDSDTASV